MKQYELGRPNKLVEVKEIAWEKKLMNPEAVDDFLRETVKLDEMAEEYVYMIATDSKMKPTAVFEVSHGTVSASMISPREVFIRLCLCGASSFVIAHNHPSGDVMPSKEDEMAYKRLKDAGELVGIQMADFLIVGDGYYSFQERSKI